MYVQDVVIALLDPAPKSKPFTFCSLATTTTNSTPNPNRTANPNHNNQRTNRNNGPRLLRIYCFVLCNTTNHNNPGFR